MVLRIALYTLPNQHIMLTRIAPAPPNTILVYGGMEVWSVWYGVMVMMVGIVVAVMTVVVMLVVRVVVRVIVMVVISGGYGDGDN